VISNTVYLFGGIMAKFTFPGGVHPDDMKRLTKGSAIEPFPMPETLALPLAQHIGAPAEALVKKGDKVLKGQLVASPKGFVSAGVHSPTSGEVLSIEERVHPLGRKTMAIIIKPDGEDKPTDDFGKEKDWKSMSNDEIKKIIGESGIVGLGGATFPSSVKLSPPPDKKIDTLIINAAECEPYLTADYRLMLEKPEELLEGCTILMKILNVERCIIGIEANKPDCYDILNKNISNGNFTGIKAEKLEVKYPQGAEIQLIYALLKREVPSGGLPMDIGVVVHNVGTVVAIRNAVKMSKPLIDRVVTVTGTPVGKKGNFLIPIGTLLKDVLDYCNVDLENTGKIIFGGPMMGLAQSSLEVPIIKGTSGILLQSISETRKSSVYEPCIRCGKCVDACPMWLMPSVLGNLSEKMKYLDCQQYGLFDCKECGSCTYVCPASRPLTQWFKVAKYWVVQERNKNKAKEGKSA
jgi:electron transport complex protein RnfC